MVKIAITGPESSGKTSLAEALSKHYSINYVPEFARDYLTQKNGVYTFEDLSYIAKKQFESVSNINPAAQLLISDTEILVLKIWSLVKYGKVAQDVLNYLQQQNFDLYLLCKPDIPWEFDPLREHPKMREELFETYKNELVTQNLPYIIIEGNEVERLKTATIAIHSLLKENEGRK